MVSKLCRLFRALYNKIVNYGQLRNKESENKNTKLLFE